MTPLLLATANAGKLRELQEMLHGLTLLSLRDVGIVDLDEPFDDFVANATIKAVEASRRAGLPCLADDSGLCVDALDGGPGVFSARFSGRHGDDAANRALLIERMRDVPDARRGARFRCVLTLADPQGPLGARVIVVQGQCAGRILREARGAKGFGYDPLFAPHGHDLSMAELDPALKNSLSHRGVALRRMLPVLRGYVTGLERSPRGVPAASASIRSAP